jgi:hypothetical protein
MKKLSIMGIVFLFILFLILPVEAARGDNGVPYQTYAEDSNRQLIPSPAAYLPIATYRSFGDFDLDSPEDVFIDHLNRMYIADSNHGRILIIEPNLASVTAIGEDYLIRPTGVYVDEYQRIYIADITKEQVIVMNSDNEILMTFEKPTAPMYGANTPFRPSKITGDSAGNLYVLSEGTYQGLVQFDKTGEFLGFFGANPTNPDLRIIILQTIFSDAVVEEFIKVIPQTMTHVTVDSFNRIYTVSRGAVGNAIKRLNISGVNRLPETMNDSSTMSSITVGPIGNIYTVGDDGLIREYDSEGNLLFQFGGLDRRSYQAGLFNTPSGIAVDDNFNLYVLDKAKNELQVFLPTDYGNLVHSAVHLYQQGLYLESQIPWEEVLAANSLFDLAHKGIGHAYMKSGDFESAMEAYRLAGYREGYSNAFWEVRNEWLTNRLSLIITLGFLLYIVAILTRKVLKLQTVAASAAGWISFHTPIVVKEWFFVGKMIKHPLDGFYSIKREHKVGWGAAIGLYFILFLESIFALLMEGASFNTNRIETISVASQFVSFIGPLLLFVGSNYLVGAVNGGEGKWKDVFIGTIYSLSPMIVFWPVVILLSRVLTLNELFIYQALTTILIAWSAILGFFMVKDIHNYSIGETIKSLAITMFTIVMIVVCVILLTSLASQAYDFVVELGTEVFLRG